jgi:hypothetical protein
MTAYLLYTKDTPGERRMTQLSESLEHEQIDVELLDADSPHGIQLVETYDIMDRPAVLLLKTDGAPIKVWQGEDGLPTASELAYLAHQ